MTAKPATLKDAAAAAHRRWGLLCCTPAELEPWYGTSRAWGARLPRTRENFCADGAKRWCAEQAEGGRCIVALERARGTRPEPPPAQTRAEYQKAYRATRRGEAMP